MPAPFHLKLTGDFFDAAGRGKYADIGLSVLDAAPHVAVERFAEHRPEIGPDQLAGANAEFVDYCNAELIPGLEMSGGYGLFQPGGRLPAHLHDFDESICIIQGTATCIVEGRRFSLADGATALVPRGRVHYFINETNATMSMLWVYAGPRPERIVVEERCATVEGGPW